MSSTDPSAQRTPAAGTHAGTGRRTTGAPTMRDIAEATGVELTAGTSERRPEHRAHPAHSRTQYAA